MRKVLFQALFLVGWVCILPETGIASIILEPVVTITIGSATVTIVAATATGFVQVDGMRVNMPAGGGRIQLVDPGIAGAQAVVDLASEHTSAAVMRLSGSGVNVQAQADIQKSITIQALTFISVMVDWFAFQDPSELDDYYFAPGVDGSLSTELTLTDLLSGATQFDQTSTITSAGAVTGPISYTRVPGISDGVEGIGTSGIPNPFSDNRYVSTPWRLDLFSNTYSAAAGSTLNLSSDFTVTTSLSESPSSGAGLMGDSITTIPEPSGWILFAVGATLLGFFRRLVKTAFVR